MQVNVAKWLNVTAKMYPNKIAMVDRERSYTWSEFRCASLSIATNLCRRNLFKQPIVIYLPKGVKVLVGFMAVAYSGNFYSPIDVDMPISRINKILSVLKPALVITSEELKEEFEQFDYSGEYLLIEDVIEEKYDEELCEKINAKVLDTDLLYVLFTSGSTGTPKGVSISHKSVIDYIDWLTETFDINSMDSFGNQAPFYFDNSILDIYCSIKTGASLYVIPKELFSQPILLLEYLKEKQINTIFWVPSALIMVSRLKAFRNVDLSNSLKRVMFCGEVMPMKQLNIWKSYLPNCVYANLYGPTEITDACTYYIVDREFGDNEALPIGKPMRNTEILVLNDNNELVSGDEIGELCVRGTSLAMGYYNNLEKTKEVFVQNPLNKAYPEVIYRTGDLVKYNDRGELIYLSRKDYQIKHMGHRIELGEIEVAAAALEGVSGCCCLYDEEKKKIVLFIEGSLEKTLVINRLQKVLPEYMLPNKVISLEKMPLNANGKVDRNKLKNTL